MPKTSAATSSTSAPKAAAVAAKEDRLYIRMSPREKGVLAQAAQARHLNTSQFVLQASLDAASQVLADQTTFALGREQWDAFCARLDAPARDIPELKALLSGPSVFDE